MITIHKSRDFNDRRHFLESESGKKLLDKHIDKLIEIQIAKRRKLKEMKRLNMPEFFRLIGECEKE